MLKVQSLPDEVTREWKLKVTVGKTWANFKTHFFKEIRCYQKDQGLTARSMCNSGNAVN